MARGARALPFAGLIATGAVAVHELRYLAAGSGADPAAGHGYLPLAGFLATVLLVAACAQLVARVARARRTGSAAGVPRRIGFLGAWLSASFSLIAVFFAQELLEGLLAGGHGADLGGVLADGGWTVLPLSAAVGALLSLCLVGARSAVKAAARAARRPAARRLASSRPELPRAHRPSGRPLARHLAGRAPPCAGW